MVIQSLINFNREKKRDPQRVTMMDIAKTVGCAESTVDKVYNSPCEVSEKTKAKILEVGQKLGYKRINKYALISPEFLTGNKTKYGTPELNTALLIALRKSGKSVRQISKITGISNPTLLRTFRNHNISTINLKTITLNGLSKTKRLAIRSAKNWLQLQAKGSDARRKIALVIKDYKNGIPIETSCASRNIDKSLAWRYLAKSYAYQFLKQKKKRPYSGQKNRCEQKFKSKKYVRESLMTTNAEELLKSKLGIQELVNEKVVYSTSSGGGRRGFTCDFYAPQTNTVFELKQRTTTSSNKSLFGQILVYKACGHQVVVVFPDDITITDSLKYILDKNQVDILLLP